jgi:4-hydroxy-3-methylbut-2-enyl diphosphate reductase
VSADLKKGKGSTMVSVGPLYHDAFEMGRLESQGFRVLENEGDITADNKVCLPVFGATTELLDLIESKGAEKLITTCPRASMAHNLAYRLAQEGYVVLVVGAPGSAEAEALLSYVRRGWNEKLEEMGGKERRMFPGAVLEAAEEVESAFTRVPDDVTHVAVLVQPNGSIESYQSIVAAAAGRFEEVRAYNTICRSVVVRVQEAARLAQKCDAMVVVGEPCLETEVMSDACRKHIRRVTVATKPGQIDPDWLQGVETVGVCVATSTSEFVLVGVVEALRRHSGAQLENGL